jgi:soluble lytic murein transglycosylase-like protein
MRDVVCTLLLLSGCGVLQGCAVEPHQLAPAVRVPSGTIVAARAPAPAVVPRAAAPARPAAGAAAPRPQQPAAAPAPAVRAAAAPAPASHATAAAQVAAAKPAPRAPAWQALPGATYAGAAPLTVAVAAPRPLPAPPASPVLEPVVLRQPLAPRPSTSLLDSSPSAFGDVEAAAVRFAGGRCSDNIYRLAWSAAELFHVQPAFVAAVIEAESGCRSDAVSVAGARGLMQLVPEGGAREGYRFMHGADHRPTLAELRDPATNIQLGVAYLGVLQDHFYFVQSAAARLMLMTAAYNCGPDFIDQRLPESAGSWNAEQAAEWIRRRTPLETRSFVVAVTEKAALYANAAAAARNSGLAGGKKNLSP